QWDEMLLAKGVLVIDVHQAWCGPCKAVVNLFRKLKNEFSEDDLLHFAQRLLRVLFSLLQNGKIIAIVRGANAPLISKKITELVEEERKILTGEKERPELESKCHFFRSVKINEWQFSIVSIFETDSILQRIMDAGFKIAMQKEIVLLEEQARQFYKEHENEDYFPVFLEQMTRGPSVIMILTKENAVEEWRQLMGPTDPEIAKVTSPESIQAQFAQDILSNAVHGSSNKEHALRSIEPGLSLNGAPGPMGTEWVWGLQVRLPRAIKAYWCPQGLDEHFRCLFILSLNIFQWSLSQIG
uniref:NME/NM23 family member 8 n=1 Tax=Apteryx owenii TaxID=8824 RepID=A0A8B9PN55_APTOW